MNLLLLLYEYKGQWRTYTGAHWDTGPTISLHGPTIKIFAYHVIQLNNIVVLISLATYTASYIAIASSLLVWTLNM